MVNRIIQVLLTRAPHWLLAIVEWMLQRDSRIIQWLKRRAAAGLPVPRPVRPDQNAEARVFFGPFNYAGQAWQWCRSLESSDSRISARNLTVVFPNDLGFESDDQVPAAVFAGSKVWKARQRATFNDFTHVVLESFTSALGEGRGSGFERELRWHQGDGRRVALLCHGTDIRSPEAHRLRAAHSPFTHSDRADERLERRVAENKRIMQSFDGPVYYSTPDLVHDVPNGSWLPLVINPSRWEKVAAAGSVPGSRAVPIVMHAPTSTKIKGTEAVERAVAALGGTVEYLPLSNIPATEMPRLVAKVDVVIDQLLLGSYGVTACEAMAAGRVVVGNVDDEVRRVVYQESGLELPIVQADPDTLEEVLERLVVDRGELTAAARKGPAFVRAVHTGLHTGRVMADFLSLPADA